MAKKKSAQSETPLFEESLAELQEIVSTLEEGTAGLEESMEHFERGVKLLRSCYKSLESAEQKIEILTRVDENGNPVLEEFDSTASIDTKGPSKTGRRKSSSAGKDSDENENDRTLF
ncbi:exodeoxyribonuclease VII small subunit [Gimesia sp.]|uniref:exodeoxyribonuclease VII small subunit n=1 Tax=uncultured Gimesia sp. TaxID=1678688 RepID=UPI000C6AF8C6|nr:exodeoxyribonuclease VII small subunit [Gimesia sp.]MAX36935.1 exodeoxyribonuclease VII small subunit [Gimesia sp.]HAH47523.1 exodeoxyribonuclease VII small subunit [Planctomycetaceae bacterium]HBL46472.1 exodeoxyribonuclease VII small subunit [Planctomycetaceae bacterium]|tara:strand:- start:452 stop:802 length:351 start_codon:yes stop_codon:yes gene_type:complete